jgi:hypothetical protein
MIQSSRGEHTISCAFKIVRMAAPVCESVLFY